jgi:hypothetical protein
MGAGRYRKDRLKTHLISFDLLTSARYIDVDGKPLQGVALEQELRPDFERFLRDRAALIIRAMQSLTAGRQPSLETVWREHTLGERSALAREVISAGQDLSSVTETGGELAVRT